MTEINTHNAYIEFGKYQGQRVTRLPVSYLTWAIAQNAGAKVKTESGVFPFCHVARAELKRRGERIQNMDVSAHAIDRLSLRYHSQWCNCRNPEEGIFSWAQRVALEAWENREKLGGTKEGETWTIDWTGIKWVIEEMAIPVVKTVK